MKQIALSFALAAALSAGAVAIISATKVAPADVRAGANLTIVIAAAAV